MASTHEWQLTVSLVLSSVSFVTSTIIAMLNLRLVNPKLQLSYRRTGSDDSKLMILIRSQSNQDTEISKIKVRLGGYRYTLDSNAITIGYKPPFMLDARTSAELQLDISGALSRYRKQMWKMSKQPYEPKMRLEVQLGDGRHIKPKLSQRRRIRVSAFTQHFPVNDS